tara:strand:- start:3268 stop:3684 length:417 start_codon:yes stop_codon:yes gene_type:complete
LWLAAAALVVTDQDLPLILLVPVAAGGAEVQAASLGRMAALAVAVVVVTERLQFPAAVAFLGKALGEVVALTLQAGVRVAAAAQTKVDLVGLQILVVKAVTVIRLHLPLLQLLFMAAVAAVLATQRRALVVQAVAPQV